MCWLYTTTISLSCEDSEKALNSELLNMLFCLRNPSHWSILSTMLCHKVKLHNKFVPVSWPFFDKRVSSFQCHNHDLILSVTNARTCEPVPRVASLFLRATAFFSLFICFLAFSINVNVFLSKWFTLQKKHKFSIFFREWNSAQAVAVVCWRSVYIQIWMKFLSFPRKILYQNVDYVKLTNVQIYTEKRSSEANFR